MTVMDKGRQENRPLVSVTAKNKKLIAHLDLQKNALETGDFSEILEHLEARRLKIAKTLMKKVGI